MSKDRHNEKKRGSVLSLLFSYITNTEKRKLVAALFGMLLSVTILVMCAISIAWFVKNEMVSAYGTQINVVVSADLVISDDRQALANDSINELNGGDPYAITQTSPVTKFYPVTHDDDYETYENGLKTINREDTANIGHTTGVGEGIRYIAAVNPVSETERHYYVDHTVYIAATPHALDNVALKMTVESASVGDSHNAASVDVYRNSASEENYIGTINVAGVDSDANRFPLQGDYVSTALTELYVSGNPEEGVSIPFREEGCLTYVLRCYFDGALLKNANQTFVRSAELDYSDMLLNILFTAEMVD